MSLTPAKMKFLDMVILDRDARRITTALGRMGVLELVKVRPETAADQAALPDRSPELDRCRALMNRLDAIREEVGLGALPASPENSYKPLDAVEQEIVGLERRIEPLRELRAKIEAESERIQDELVRFDMLDSVTVPLSQVLESPFLHFAAGNIKTTDLEKLQAAAGPNIVLLSGAAAGERRNLVAFTSRERQAELDAQLRQHNFVTEDISPLAGGAPAATLDRMRKRLDEIRSDQERISHQLKEVARTEAQKIASLERSLELELALLEASLNFSRTESTCRISGWLPADQVAPASSRLLQETEGRLFLQVREAEETDVPPDEVPVLMKDNPLIRPFQLLVTGFGFPRYREIQPTLLVAISFLVMYGLMFGDVGQGVVLVIVGFVMRKRCGTPQTRDLGTIISMAGIAATAFGFLYGSVFGYEEWLRYSWKFEPMKNVVTMLAVPVALGIVLISVGIVVNIINKFRRGQYFRGIMDRIGVVGIIFYWGAIGLGLRYALLGSGSLWLVACAHFRAAAAPALQGIDLRAARPPRPRVRRRTGRVHERRRGHDGNDHRVPRQHGLVRPRWGVRAGARRVVHGHLQPCKGRASIAGGSHLGRRGDRAGQYRGHTPGRDGRFRAGTAAGVLRILQQVLRRRREGIQAVPGRVRRDGTSHTGRRRKMAQGGRKFLMAALLALVVVTSFGAQACLAAGAETAAKAVTGFGDNSALALAAAIVVGLSCLAAAMAVGRVGAAALGMASERPELLMKSLIFVVVAEGIAIYGLLMGIMLWTLIK